MFFVSFKISNIGLKTVLPDYIDVWNRTIHSQIKYKSECQVYRWMVWFYKSINNRKTVFNLHTIWNMFIFFSWRLSFNKIDTRNWHRIDMALNRESDIVVNINIRSKYLVRQSFAFRSFSLHLVNFEYTLYLLKSNVLVWTL